MCCKHSGLCRRKHGMDPAILTVPLLTRCSGCILHIVSLCTADMSSLNSFINRHYFNKQPVETVKKLTVVLIQEKRSFCRKWVTDNIIYFSKSLKDTRVTSNLNKLVDHDCFTQLKASNRISPVFNCYLKSVFCPPAAFFKRVRKLILSLYTYG